MQPTPSDAPASTFMERLQARMNELGLNPHSAAKKAGLAPGYVHDLLRGKVKEPSASRLAALATALECSPSWLMGLDPLSPDNPEWIRSAGVLVERNLRSAVRSKEANFVFNTAAEVDEVISERLKDFLPDLDAEDTEELFKPGPHRGMQSRIYLIHALGVINDVERAALLALCELGRIAYSSGSGFDLQTEPYAGLAATINSLFFTGTPIQNGAKIQSLIGIFASLITLSMRDGRAEANSVIEDFERVLKARGDK